MSGIFNSGEFAMSRGARHLTPGTPYMTGRAPSAPDEIARRELSRRLIEIMMKRNLKQVDLAEGVFGRYAKNRANNAGNARGRDSISKWVRGLALPEPRNLQRLADYLGVKTDDLIPPSAFHRAAHENPAVEIRQITGEPGMAWLIVNRACSTMAAAQILDILNQDDEKRRLKV